MIIYKITNKINNKIYIGQTTTDLKVRWKDHRRFKNRQMHPIKYAIQKYGEENFIIEQIDSASSIEELNQKEEYWISFYNSTDKNVGYNLMRKSQGIGAHSPETIQKMRESHLGKPRKPHSEKTKKLFSEMRKGKPSPHKGKKGRPKTEDEKKAISKRFKGRPAPNKGISRKNQDMIYIRKQKNRFQVIILSKFIGSFKTIEEAKQIRDEYLKSLDKQE